MNLYNATVSVILPDGRTQSFRTAQHTSWQPDWYLHRQAADRFGPDARIAEIRRHRTDAADEITTFPVPVPLSMI